MYWYGTGGWGATGSGDPWGGGAAWGSGKALKGKPWGGGKGDAWGGGGGKGDAWGGAWDGGKGDPWGGQWGGQWGGCETWDAGNADPGGAPGKNKKEKAYHNCTYLGVGRHRLPHEDRCTLAGLTLDLIFEDTGVQIPTMAVAAWREKSCNAFFYLLASAQPSTRLQQMLPRGQKFTLEAAAEGLIQMWKVLISEPAKRVEQANQILQWCIEDQEKMVAEAMKKGMEEHDVVSGAPLPGPVTGAPPARSVPENAGTRALVRSDTNEEHDRVKKKETHG